MISVLIYNGDKTENKMIESEFSKTAGLDDLGRVLSSTGIETLKKHSAEMSVSDELILCADFASDGKKATHAVKSGHGDTSVVVLADPSIPPFDYITPEVMPSGVILRPMYERNVNSTMNAVVASIRSRRKAKLMNGEVFVINTKEENLRIPYADVLFFEAREKRIDLCTGKMEYPFYSTLDKLMGELPDYFLRCHKGFIVNSLLIEKASYSENLLLMHGGFTVPLSRGCKQSVKEALS